MPKAQEEHKMSLEDAVSAAFGEITTLGEEMREAYDNTPENLQQAAIGEARDQAASDLENISEAEVPDILKDSADAKEKKFEISWTTSKMTAKQQMRQSRSDRRDGAVQILDACIDHLDKIADDESVSEEVKEAASELRDELDNAKSEVEAVDFPGRNA